VQQARREAGEGEEGRQLSLPLKLQPEWASSTAGFGKPINFWAKFLCWFSLKQVPKKIKRKKEEKEKGKPCPKEIYQDPSECYYFHTVSFSSKLEELANQSNRV
jgi:hypothetical protein